MVKRDNIGCKFFPCHKGLEDCTFCYCPFYPCLNESRGNYVYSNRLKRDVWSCQDCNWIHKKNTVDEIFNLIRKSNLIKIPSTIHHPPSTDNSKIGIIILGHGSKLHKANGLISKVAKIIKKEISGNIVEPSYLQFHQPNLSESIKKVVEKGCKKIIIVPFFLFSGNHVKRDIPQAIKKEMDRYPDCTFVFTESMGEDGRIVDIVLQKINEAIRKCA